jgi:DNA modification methylase
MENKSIVLARKPIEEKTITDNVLKYGTGGINIDGCRIGTDDDLARKKYLVKSDEGRYNYNNGKYPIEMGGDGHNEGRFPANFIIDEDASKILDEQSGQGKSTSSVWNGFSGDNSLDGWKRKSHTKKIEGGYDDNGGASRFFYNIKNIDEDKINKQINEKGKMMETKNENVKLMLGNNIDKLKELPDNFVDSIITDPPYGISFMNKKWDYDVPSVEFWKEVYRVLKPGGHILSFGGTRTYHRMVVNIEDAGFEIRDQIMWVYGSGFPKSHNIGKAVDKIEGKDVPTGKRFNVSGQEQGGLNQNKELRSDNPNYVKPKYDNEWEGWGTGLKPANEPICMARKPIEEKTITDNVLKYGTGGINIDGCRVGFTSENDKNNTLNAKYTTDKDNKQSEDWGTKQIGNVSKEEGRFPANFIIECTCDEVISGENNGLKKETFENYGNGEYGKKDGRKTQPTAKKIEGTWYKDTGDIHTNPDCPCRLLDEQSGESKSVKRKKVSNTISKPNIDFGGGIKNIDNEYEDTGGASRFFYVPKVGKKERNLGLDNFEDKEKDRGNALKCGTCGLWILRASGESCKCGDDRVEVKGTTKNNHPTVKPINLLTYLVRLITPPNGIVMDCYMGSGSTGIATLLEGFQFIGMEMDEDYFKIAETRINNYELYKDLIKKK